MPDNPQQLSIPNDPLKLEDMFALSTSNIDALRVRSLDEVFAENSSEEDEDDTLKTATKGSLLRRESVLRTDPLDETFAQFFKENAPARALLFDSLRSTVATTFGTKHKSLRSELFEEFQGRQRIAASVQRNTQTATLGFDKLEEQIRANLERERNTRDKTTIQKIRTDNEARFKVQDLTNKSLRLQNDIANDRITNEEKISRTKKNNKELDLLVDKTPFQFIIRNFQGTFEEKLDEYTKWLAAQAIAKDAPSKIKEFISDEQVRNAAAAVSGGVTKLNSLPEELEGPVRAVLYAERFVEQNPQFRKEAAESLSGVTLFKQLTDLVREAKEEAGIRDTSPQAIQRLQGLFATAFSATGAFEFLNKVRASVKTQGAQGTQFAKSAGESRPTDQDLVRFLAMLPHVGDSEGLIRELFDVGNTSMLRNLVNKINTLPQINPPKITARLSVRDLQEDAKEANLSLIQFLIKQKQGGIVYE